MPSRESGPPMQSRREFAQPPDPPRPGVDRLYFGQLIDHGPSPHEFHPKGPPSYYVKLKTDHGVVTLWGKGIERAFADSKTKPKLDDLIAVRENNYDPISVVVRKKQVDGVVIPERKYDTPRPRWVVEKLEEFDRRRFAAEALRDPTISRRDAVGRHRDLHGFYNVLDVAQKFATRRMQEPERRQGFMKVMREILAVAFERAEPPPISSPQQAPTNRGRPDASAPQAKGPAQAKVPE